MYHKYSSVVFSDVWYDEIPISLVCSSALSCHSLVLWTFADSDLVKQWHSWILDISKTNPHFDMYFVLSLIFSKVSNATNATVG